MDDQNRLCRLLDESRENVDRVLSVYDYDNFRLHQQDFQRLEFSELLDSIPKGKSVIRSILRDDKDQLICEAKQFIGNFEEDQLSDVKRIFDRNVSYNLLRLCCMFDSVECASALISGEVVGIVPCVNDGDVHVRSALHTAAEAHASRCIELLLRKHARTDLKSKDRHSQLALEMSLSSRRMDVVWTVDEPIEHLLICLNQKDLTAVRLLSEKTKEIADVACAIAMDGKVVPLAALLMVAANTITTSTVVRNYGGLTESMTIYDSVIKEVLSLGLSASSSPLFSSSLSSGGQSWSSTTSSSNGTGKRELLLYEMELLQLYGSVSQRSCADKKVTSPLICAAQAGDEAVVEILLKTRIDMKESDSEGNTALHWSLKITPSSSQIKIMSLLLMHGARVGQRNRMGLTALHIAAANGNSQALQILLPEDPDGVHTTTETKETPLFFAVKNDYKDIVELLLQWGANSEVLNLRKERPIDFAKSQDMRWILNPVNISGVSYPCFSQTKHTVILPNDCPISETCESLSKIPDNESSPDRICQGTKTETCSYSLSPSGSARGPECFYAHESQLQRPGEKQTSLRASELRRKVLIGRFPSSLNTVLLLNYFEQFGPVKEVSVCDGRNITQQSRWAGLVTFTHEKSAVIAIQTQYISIMGNQVEIRSAVPKSMLLSELQNPSPELQKDQEPNSQPVPKTPSANSLSEPMSWAERLKSQPVPQAPSAASKSEPMPSADNLKAPQIASAAHQSEPMSWADRLFRSPQKSSSNKTQANRSPPSVNKKEPAWLQTFKKWLPKYLKQVCGGLKEGEWYALSSLKSDFRATCGVELDHASLGYTKLSDFMKSLPGICHMKIAPVGLHGIASHMVLLPHPDKTKVMAKMKPTKMPESSPSAEIDPKTSPCAESVGENGVIADHDEDLKLLNDVLFFSRDNFPLHDNTSDCGQSLFHEAPQRKTESLFTVQPRFLQFLQPDPIFHVSPFLRNTKGGHTDATSETEGERNPYNGQRRHLVLEVLAKKQKNTSAMFLRDLDFFKNYKASVAQGKCFACNQVDIVWANVPCKHLLWCEQCKVQAVRVAGSLDHKCVICDGNILGLVRLNENPNQYKGCEVSAAKKFLTYENLNSARCTLEQMRSPMLSQ